MTRYLSVDELLILYQAVMQQSGGLAEIRNLAGLESALAQPRATCDGQELYDSLATKAAALAYGLIQNHPFIDGNKRIGHAAMEVFLLLNGYEIRATVDEQENLILGAASGTITREAFVNWIQQHIISFDSG
jgi:death-on-curing protein